VIYYTYLASVVVILVVSVDYWWRSKKNLKRVKQMDAELDKMIERIDDVLGSRK